MCNIYVRQGSLFEGEILQRPGFRIKHSKAGDQRSRLFFERRYLTKRIPPGPCSGLIFKGLRPL